MPRDNPHVLKECFDLFSELFKVIESEIISFHDGNIARFKIRPSEFQAWQQLQ